MNRTELVAKVYGDLLDNESKDVYFSKHAVGNVLSAIIKTIQEEVKNGGEVLLPGFAKFDSVTKPERSGNNPLNGKPYHSPAKRVPKITAGKAFKDALQ